jgi:hypothetical protein
MIDNRGIFIVVLFIASIDGIPSNSYYLIDIAQNSSSNENYCSNLLINEQIYRIPQPCQHHLLCDPYYCDDQTFRCVKIRETLCCLRQYLQLTCQDEHFVRTRDRFRSVYFHMSIEHGYCEINLERIEKHDQAYCLANDDQVRTSTSTATSLLSTRSTYKHFHRRLSTLRTHRNHHRLATRQNHSSLNNFDYLRQVTIIDDNLLSNCAINSLDRFLLLTLFLSRLF